MVVNLLVVILARKLGLSLGTNEHDIFFNLLGTRWNIRYSHVYATVAFLVANMWNFQLNRVENFPSARTTELVPAVFALPLSRPIQPHREPGRHHFADQSHLTAGTAAAHL